MISSTSPVSHRLHLAHLSSTSPSSLAACTTLGFGTISILFHFQGLQFSEPTRERAKIRPGRARRARNVNWILDSRERNRGMGASIALAVFSLYSFKSFQPRESVRLSLVHVVYVWLDGFLPVRILAKLFNTQYFDCELLGH